jgi:hypothetical protein
MIVQNKQCNDIKGNIVKIGDKVAVAITPYSKSAALRLMYVAAITKKSIICAFLTKDDEIHENHIYDESKHRYMYVPNKDVTSPNKCIVTGQIRGEGQILKLDV